MIWLDRSRPVGDHALMELKQTASCELELPEAFFDADYRPVPAVSIGEGWRTARINLVEVLERHTVNVCAR